MEVSGLDEELDLSRDLPRLLYVKAPAPGREPRLADLLGRIRQEDSYRTFATPAELGRLVRDDLAILLSERFTAAAGPPDRSLVPASPRRAAARGPRALPGAHCPALAAVTVSHRAARRYGGRLSARDDQ